MGIVPVTLTKAGGDIAGAVTRAITLNRTSSTVIPKEARLALGALPLGLTDAYTAQCITLGVGVSRLARLDRVTLTGRANPVRTGTLTILLSTDSLAVARAICSEGTKD